MLVHSYGFKLKGKVQMGANVPTTIESLNKKTVAEKLNPAIFDRIGSRLQDPVVNISDLEKIS